jgi:hypothetical protein
MSDLIIVDRTERLMSGEIDPGNPLQVGNRLIYPVLGQPLRRARAETAPSTSSSTARMRRRAHGCM